MVTVSRVANATRGELLCITYEILLENIKLAIEQQETREIYLKKAIETLHVLAEGLNLEYALAGEILRLYIYVQGLLLTYKVTDKELEEAYFIIRSLLEGYQEVCKHQTETQVSMQNTETVYAGITYGRTELDEIVLTDSNRGFKA
ncbi:flagellar protein FliS [Sporanaerobium hydrogeniformans]|uniref:flagellar protein FliS n=1 Tax=Sporanaerobium hydrogeniformans TaxID=3072179 RepID=UPI0015D4A4BF|nr:flagellar protein FliS [Sporanaerobium hydrogeniformans]